MRSTPSGNHSPIDFRAKEAQLIIGLKFHYGETLKDLPIDVAVDAMVKVWESCQAEKGNTPKPHGLMVDQPRKINGSSTINL